MTWRNEDLTSIKKGEKMEFVELHTLSTQGDSTRVGKK
jgi:hypothetical protein